MGRIVHLASYDLDPHAHPPLFRTVTGLAASHPSVLLTDGRGGYRAAGAGAGAGARRAGGRGAAAAAIPVHGLATASLRNPSYARYVAAGLRRRYGRVDAVLGHLGNQGGRAVHLARALDAPILTLFGGSDANVALAQEKYRPWFESLRAAPEARYLAVSESLRARLLDFGMDPARTHLVRRGLDLERYRPAPPASGAAAGTLRLVLVGRLVPVKGHAVALEALRALRERVPDATLDVFGDGPLRAELRKRAAERGLAQAVRLHGAVDVDALRERLGGFDVAIQPSVTDPEGQAEGVPNAVLEAMARGLPVVASRHGGIPEAVQDGETGLLVPEGDAPALAEALAALAADPARRRRLGAAGRRWVEEACDQRVQSRRLAALVDETIAAYRALPKPARAARWERAVAPVAGLHGSRGAKRLGWAALTVLNRWRGRVG